MEVQPEAVKKNSIASWMVLLGFFIVLFDQLSKFYVISHIPLLERYPYVYPYGGIAVFRNFFGIEFSLNYMTNQGAAWGVLGDYQLLLVGLRILLILYMSYYLIFQNRDSLWQLPLILIIAGALGNVIDFFIYGHVVDMFHFILWGYDFPIFNIADAAITTGVVFLLLSSWLKMGAKS